MSENPDVEIAIVGAGLAGVGIAIALQCAGLTDFVILDRQPDFGGTWYTNRYPDVGADIPGLLYQFSFAKFHWSRVFPHGSEIQRYITQLVHDYGLRKFARLSTDVLARTWDEADHVWRLDLDDGTQLISRYMVAADGMFIRPRLPDVEGLGEFRGRIIQSQGWPDEYDFGGKRVGVIGTGASGVQIIPRLAEMAGHLVVFQRRGAWVFPKPDLRMPSPVTLLFTRFPSLYTGVFKTLNWFVGNGFGLLASRGIRLQNVVWLAEKAVEGYIRLQVPDPAMRRKLRPTYPLTCKRPTISNRYYSTFARSDVDLVVQAIDRVDATGIVTIDGSHHDLDVLVLATGFDMAASSVGRRDSQLRGHGGFDLAEHYADEKEAAEFEGVLLPELPNGFIVCGRYSWAGPSHCSIVERAAVIIVRLISEAKARNATRLAVTDAAAQRFSADMVHRQAGSFAHISGCRAAQTYFLDEHGISSVYRPTSMSSAMWRARNLSMADFNFGTLRDAHTNEAASL